MSNQTVKVLVVDDTVVYRKIVSDVLTELPGVKVIGSANNGKIAMQKIGTLRPDLLILDVEMPEADGLEVLAHIKQKRLDVGAIMLSSYTQKGSERTIQALELGAFDFIPKPETSSMEQSRRAVKESLSRVVEAFIRQAEIKSMLGRRPVTAAAPARPAPAARPGVTAARKTGAAELVAIGISTGGPNALKEMLPKLPGDLGVPVLIVQHMPPVFTKSLADSLNGKCALRVVEAQDGQAIEPNVVYIAPGGRQMKIVQNPTRAKKIVRLTNDPPENGCRPSVDYLFRSISQVCRGPVTAVIMTGMGCDGKLGMRLLKRNGATTIAQDQASCVVYGMPKEVIDAGLVDVVAPLASIDQEICKTVRAGKKAVMV